MSTRRSGARFPDDAGAYFAARGFYHEKLHAFRDAFAVSERWLSRHPGDLAAESNLAESYFTNGRFTESDSRITALLAEDRLEPRTKIALRAVQIAALLAQEKTDAMAERLADLHATVAAQPEQFKGGWTLAGTNHFIAQHEGLRKHAWLSELLTAVGAADQTTMLMVIGPRRVSKRWQEIDYGLAHKVRHGAGRGWSRSSGGFFAGTVP